MTPEPSVLPPRRVLLIDDSEFIRDLFALTLTASGYDVRAAEDGAVALKVLRTWRPDLILLDLMMPDLNGWGFLDAQVAHAQFKDIPVVVLSATHNDQRAARYGMVVAVRAKPIGISDLLALVREVTERVAA